MSREIIIDRFVLGAAVVPDGDAVGPPLETAGELRRGDVAEQELQQRVALGAGEPLDMGREQAVDEDDLSAGFRVGANNRVAYRRVGGDSPGQALPAAGLGQALLEAVGEIVRRGKILQEILHRRR